MSKVPEHILTRVYLVLGLFSLIAIAILFRIVKIQYVENEMWEQKAESERIRMKKYPATRGSILADDGTVLASSQQFYKLSIDPSVIRKDDYKDFESSLDSLCKYLALTFGDSTFNSDFFRTKITTAMDMGTRHLYLIKKPVNFTAYDEAAHWPVLKESRYHGGLLGEKLSNKRVYPFGNLGRITLGIVRGDTVPVKGLEFSCNEYLAGEDGLVLVQKINGETEIPVEGFGETGAVDGDDIVTTINIGMQDIAEKALRSNLEKHNAKFGTAILMEVQTGAIKAIVNLKRDENGNYYEGYNYALAGQVEPGSTFKLASMMAALEDHAVNVSDSIETGAGYCLYYDKAMRDEIALGKITYREGFEKSSNVAISKMTDGFYRLDPGKFISRLNQFGLLSTVNQQLRGEPVPEVKIPAQPGWDGTSLPWLSIGYNIRLTPLQILAFYNAVANDGRKVQPFLVSQVRRNSSVRISFNPVVLEEKICSDATLAILKELLEGVVESGTARTIQTNKIRMAGKTGTAKKVVNGVYVDAYQSSFVGYFPAGEPRYSCFVLIDEPAAGQIYGARVAAPVFLEIASRVQALDAGKLRMYTSPPVAANVSVPSNRMVFTENANRIYRELGFVVTSLPDEMYSNPLVSREEVALQPVKISMEKMPNVRGMSARDAVCLLENLGLEVTLSGSGRVIAQAPVTGTAIRDEQNVVLELK